MKKLNEQVETIFATALELPDRAERAAYLDRACPSAEIRREVESLLSAHEQPDKIFEEETQPFQQKQIEGTRIGRYKLLQQIGEGGMGLVYMAEQEEPVRRRVALKIIKLGMDTRAVVARFEAERQALALMDHPNVATVLDGGVTETGRPYFVMELVQGVPITTFCAKAQLPSKERLRLLMQVCQAIQSAHQKGIIHRDIKPSNILVTLHDGVPVPKVIDFGIAKATNQKLTEKTLFTNFGTMIGTPAYMSPEQAEMSGLDVDTRTDIYSLGVLLYELLTGTTPFPEQRLRSLGYGELQRVIAEEEPQRPSTRLSTMAKEQRVLLARTCGEEVSTLSKLLRGDLDWIVMKCLEKDRGRRYESASELAADLERYLTQEPITARPPTAVYRLSKTLRRHRVAFAAASGIALALLVGATVSTWQAIRAGRAERAQGRLAEEAQRKERLAEKAQAAERQQRELADKARAVAEGQAYAADIFSAQQALAVDNQVYAMALLDRHRPQGAGIDRRRWEWRFLWQQCQSEALFNLGNGLDGNLAVSADGNWLAVGIEGVVSVWDLQARREAFRLPAAENQVLTAWSPTGTLLAYSSVAGTKPGSTAADRISIWDLSTQKLVSKIPLEREAAFAFSADGKVLVTAIYSDSLALWNVPEGRLLKRFSLGPVKELHGNPLALAPDLSFVVLPSTNVGVSAISTETGQPLWSTPLGAGPLTAIALSRDGKVVAAAAGWADGTPRLLDAADGHPLGELRGHRGWISQLIFFPDGKTLASASGDHTIRLWDISEASRARQVSTLRGHKSEIVHLVLRPGTTQLISDSADKELCLWDVTSRPQWRSAAKLQTWRGIDENELQPWYLSSDGQIVRALDIQGRLVQWSGGDYTLTQDLFSTGADVGSICFSADGRTIATGHFNGVVKLWDIERRAVDRQFKAVDGPAVPWAFIGNKLLVTENPKGSFHEFNLENLKETLSWPGTGDGQRTAISADGRFFLMLNYYQTNGTLRDRQTGEVREFSVGKSAIRASFSPDGKFFAIAFNGGVAELWDRATLQRRKTFRGFLQGAKSAIFSPEGDRLVIGASGREAIKIWDFEQERELLTLEGDGGEFFSSAFSSDGNALGALSQEGLLHIWRAPTLSEIGRLEAKR